MKESSFSRARTIVRQLSRTVLLATFIVATAADAFTATYHVIHRFIGGIDGGGAYAGVVFDAAGNLYGATCCGGSANDGVAFKLSPSVGGTWEYTVLHVFQGKPGRYPAAALVPDGPAASPSRGTLVRIWRRELGTSKDQEFAYRTEPLGAGRGGDMGVSELAALSGDGLLVLERGYQKGYGNTVRIFRTVLTGARDISGASSLDEGTPSLEKALVVDLAALHDPGMLLRGPQPNSLLENYEAMSIGPVLADGRRLLFLISDDNGRADQVTRILVLSLRLP